MSEKSNLHYLNDAAREYDRQRQQMLEMTEERAELIAKASEDVDLAACIEIEQIGFTSLPLSETRQDVFEDVGIQTVFEDIRTFYGLDERDFTICLEIAYDRFEEQMQGKIVDEHGSN
jgi:hypothetical protein